MKLSRFNVEVLKDENLIIYNTMSGGVLKLEKNYIEEYKKIKDFSDSCENEELLHNLIKGGMLVGNDIDEIGRLKIIHNRLKYASDTATLSIAPTMKCNFVCPYCYEKGRNLHSMSREVIDAIKKYVDQLKENTKYLGITWYGGEPLLALDIIDELSEHMINLFGENYSASMVTNGYNLTDKVVLKLEKLKVNNIQVTIDGPPDIHNKMRKLPSGKDTFFVILNNIGRALLLYPQLRITIRVNTDKTNIQRTDEIIDYLLENDLLSKVGLYLAPIDNINGTCNVEKNCFTNSEFATEQIKFMKRNIKYSEMFVNIPNTNPYICGAVATNSYVIDPLGDVYKCWDDISDKERCIGNIQNGINYSVEYTKWILYDPFNDKQCGDCIFLPLCMGGCPNHYIKNKMRKCMPIKENVKELIELLYEVRKEL